MLKPLLIFAWLLVIGCTSNTSKSSGEKKDSIISMTYPVKPLQILTEEEEGWGADVRLSIVKVIHQDSVTQYKILSTYNGKEIGFEIIIPAKLSIKGALEFRSTGQNSDEFLHVLSKLYNVKSDSLKYFTKSCKLTGIDLNEFANDKLGAKISIIAGLKEMKLFYEPANENDYAELYLNINENEQWVEVKEKDEEYRKAVLGFLSSPLY